MTTENDQLRAENARLRQTLSKIAQHVDFDLSDFFLMSWCLPEEAKRRGHALVRIRGHLIDVLESEGDA